MGAKQPYFIAILFQCIAGAMFILSKAALNEGMNSFVFIFYRQITGALVLIAVIIFKRESPMPLSFMTFWKIFVLSLVGVAIGFNVYAVALNDTSSSLAAAIGNCLQPMVFFLAIVLRMEKWKPKTIGGVAKIVGIMLCMLGVVTLALYKGPYLHPIVHHHLLDSRPEHNDHSPGDRNWMKGCFLMFFCTICWALVQVYQAPVMKDCPSRLIFTAFQCLLGAIQSGVVAIAVERDISQWKLGWDIKLVAVLGCGFMTSAVASYLLAWMVEKKGPVFPAMWTPLSLVITTLFSTFLLGDVITLGSLLGAILLVGSLYCVLWGKSKEEQEQEQEQEEKLKKLNDQDG